MGMAREEAIKQCEDFIKHHSDWSVEIEWAKGMEFVLEDYKRLIEQEPCDDWCDVPSDEMTLGQARQAVKDLRKKLAEYLEQEPILDKIRAEIKELTSNRGFLSCEVDEIHKEIDMVFDKYKAEEE